MEDADTAPSFWSRLWAWRRTHGRRVALVALALFVAAVAVEVGGAYPRAVHVSLPMGANHADVTEARIDVRQGGETVTSVTRHFAGGAPRAVRETVELSPGEYDVAVRLTERGGDVRRLSARLTAPSDGVVRLALEGT
ncbi:MAG TPA: hypothetical protein RMH99_01860 [Sandaracinaceae bacterium LLY-WYZ-13_1]|nr:hypothetical protein [Sandaracinaceae bacterium LLY-WYZ-13_1]